MIKYAIISDIHGNITALNAVLADIKNRNIDKIICLGDTIGKGCHSHECLILVKEQCDVVLLGNNDIEYIKSLDEIVVDSKIDFDYEAFYFNQKQLSADDIDYIKSLPMCCEFYLSGCLVRCFHASPYDKSKLIFEYASIPEKLMQFYPTGATSNKVADIAVFGHTHSLSMEGMFARRLVNAGSVGNPSNFAMRDDIDAENKHLVTMAQYVILEGEDSEVCGAGLNVNFISLPYDIEKELSEFTFFKEQEVYEKELKTGKYRHQERMIKKLIDSGSKMDKI